MSSHDEDAGNLDARGEMHQHEADMETDGESEPCEVSLQDLITFVVHAGYDDVTARQIERWHKEEDLLPHPRQAHLPGVRGSRTLFPASARQQLLGLCQLMAADEGHRLDFDELRIALWIRGYAIPIERVRASIRTLAVPSLRALRRLFSRGSVRFRDQLEAAEYFAKQLLPHVRQGDLGQIIRNRIPDVQDQLSFTTMGVQLLLGDVPAFDSIEEYLDEDDDAHDKSFPELLRDVYGLERAQTDTILDEKPWLPTNIAPALVNMAKVGYLSLRRMRHVLASATAEEFERAREEREMWFIALPQVVRAAEAFAGENVAGLGMFRMLDDLMPQDDPSVQALQVLVSLVLHSIGTHDARMGEGLEQVLGAIHLVAPIAEHTLKVLDALRRELPEAAEMLTCNVHALRTRHAFEQHLSTMRTYYQEHKADLDAFWTRHPDLYELPASGAPTQ